MMNTQNDFARLQLTLTMLRAQLWGLYLTIICALALAFLPWEQPVPYIIGIGALASGSAMALAYARYLMKQGDSGMWITSASTLLFAHSIYFYVWNASPILNLSGALASIILNSLIIIVMGVGIIRSRKETKSANTVVDARMAKLNMLIEKNRSQSR